MDFGHGRILYGLTLIIVGMAYRLAMEAGVHRECTVDRLKNSDANVYRALLYACLIYER
jgi:hypothetical protein